ncbi:gluconate:H+ symporter [Sporolactobacillus terrae]|uniref:2-keto-3-deoxygluconate permease n=1 Tax=Sporolactobacillus terrae TaxID=269673 RepID=A0ABX5Q5E6_9BACL|nr:gluconate:H+ symporter [Sporolactobacillus terrae]QAA21840.1 2-keto-3-deoxygluconate permease [Sporolactobacillus terrae]QAA24813.1 2-keto-3-deoxygluconate permease [Sporolactobacillus terrae]UAK16636.1 GntP family permease [Sporolactobacillus terrae]
MSSIYLISITVLAIGLVILGVTWFKWHAFISLSVASLFLGIAAGLPLMKIAQSYETGVGGILSSLLGILALGTILGKMMSESGAGLQIAQFFTRAFGDRLLPWATFFAGLIISIPVFFEVGLVILLPLVIAIQKTTKKRLLLIAIPMISALSISHGIVPPHPGAMAAIGIFHADVGQVLIYSLLVSLPAGIIGGPIFAYYISKRIQPVSEPKVVAANVSAKTYPSTFVSFFTILLPIILMIGAVAVPFISMPGWLADLLNFLGHPLIALLVSVFVSYYLLGIRRGIGRKLIEKLTGDSLAPLASIMMIIGAGGAFKQVLIASGVGGAIAELATNWQLSPLVMAFVVAGLIRIATGSATVALTTAAGIVAPIVANMTGVNLPLLVIATGAGSLMFSHVNDAGFWLVKEYLGLSVKQTFKVWTVLETLLSFAAFALVLVLDLFI